MTPRRRSELYRLGVGLAALGLLLAGVTNLVGVPIDLGVAVSLFVAGVLALQFPVHINLSQKLSVASAVFIAAALLMPMWQAAALVAATSAVDTAISAAKRSIRTREKPPWAVIGLSVLFNSGQLFLTVLAAAALLSAAHVSARAELRVPEGILAIVAAASAMYVVNLFLVATAVALSTRRGPLAVFQNTHRVVLAEFASLYLVGAVAAFVAVRVPWLLMLALLPAIIVYRSLQYRIELRRESVRAMERMADEVDSRDPYTYQHSKRVAQYSHAIARKLGLSAGEAELVELAAKVHDIGKIRLPDSILLKPDRLTAEERRVMETHPRLGYDILRQFAEYAKVLELVLTHHERYDGAGYPNGIVGRRLLLIAQIIPVADSLDAMTSNRAYRGARTWQAALNELSSGAGAQWNPKVVQAAVEALSGHEEGVARAPQPAIA